MPQKIKIVFVCLGNICRSPTADAVMRAKVKEAGLDALVSVDSCGTAGYHEGSAPDKRSRQTAEAVGYSMAGIVSRPLTTADYHQADYLLAMDSANFHDLKARQPVGGQRAAINMLMNYAQGDWPEQVPDPYYGGEQGFTQVLEMVEAACDGLLEQIQKRLTEE